MKNSIDIKQLLNVFNKVTREGVKKEDRYVLNQIVAWTDFDGYTCFMEYKDVKITIYFHNKYHVEAPNERSLEAFEELIDKMARVH